MHFKGQRMKFSWRIEGKVLKFLGHDAYTPAFGMYRVRIPTGLLASLIAVLYSSHSPNKHWTIQDCLSINSVLHNHFK
jgi:hypothetical protein